ncbi:MAG TPA: hypothetical protein VLJ17_01995 [Xanthobacteraceae bacterium]|nr:hypothetical protein [Xanthobacteraceae bacterium]
MTIREHFKQRFRWAIAAAFGSWILIAVFAMTHTGDGATPLFFVGFAIFIGAILFMNFGIRCPKCRGNLGMTIGHAFMTFGASKHRIGFCPFCGTSIDENIVRDGK